VNGSRFALHEGKLDDGCLSNARETTAHRPTPACATLRGALVRAQIMEVWAALRRQEYLPHEYVFFCRLEMRSGECFVEFTAISNPFQCRLEILGEEMGGAGWGASGGRRLEPLRRCIEM
jgi:hypothetical protein